MGIPGGNNDIGTRSSRIQPIFVKIANFFTIIEGDS